MSASIAAQQGGELYVGLMSGTSLDGIDAVLAKISNDSATVLASSCYPFEPSLRQQLLALVANPEQFPLGQVLDLDIQLGHSFAQAANQLIQASGYSGPIAAIGSHGQTVLHRPDGPLPSSLQIGDANIIAEQTGVTTIADFRRADVAAGGQGAPLVPAFHHFLFSSTTEARVLLNIGGMANISYLPAAGGPEAVLGQDSGPGNVLMDYWINQQQSDKTYDQDGQWAASGRVQTALLAQMLGDDYFQRQGPKSTGRELFCGSWLNQLLQGHQYPAEDIQATLCELTAISAAAAIKRHCTTATVYVCGGGRLNQHLLQRLAAQLPHAHVKTTEALGIDGNSLEALAFAWLARQRLHGHAANVAAVTGANGPRVLGAIYSAQHRA